MLDSLKQKIKKSFSLLVRAAGYKIERYETEGSDPDDVEKLRTAGTAGGSIKLHFGCGPRVIKGWINIDLAFEPYEKYLVYYGDEHYPAEIRGTREDFYQVNILKDGLPLPDNSVDLIFHEDFFEHLNQRDQFVFLAETFRVMKKDATQRINTPNIVESMRSRSDFSKGKDGVHIQEWNNWHHFNIISPATIKDMAEIVGFSEIHFNKKNESIVAPALPLEYRPNVNDRPAPDSNVFADLVK